MIHEYALEPKLVASWHDRMNFRFFVKQFGFGEARIISLYPKGPKRWNKLVWEAFEADFGGTASPVDRTRMNNLLKKIMKPVVRRPNRRWDATCDWLANAEKEHECEPFHTILARNNPRQNANVVLEDDVLDERAECWDAPGTMTVSRTAEEMAKCVAPMLRCATEILLIDPYFRANEERFRKPLAAFLQGVDTRASNVTAELHTADRDKAPSWEEFRKECKDKLPSIIPEGLTLTVYRWKERDGGEKLHNRYILTNIGGVSFGTGLDEGDLGMTDDVSRLSADTYNQRWNDYGSCLSADINSQRRDDYAGPKLAFKRDGEPFSITRKK